VVLSLTNSGALTEIPVPKGRPQQPPSSANRKLAKSRTKPGSRRRARDANGRGTSPAGERASERPTGALGPCPLCGSDVIEQEKSFSCGGWRSGCNFAIWKTIAGKPISTRTAQALLHRGRSQVLKGFKSKSGRAFDARLKLDQGVVRFDFES
jgi:DNA topoisomerase-3